VDDPATTAIAPVALAEIAVIVDTETGVAPATAIRPATTEREHLAARPGVKPVGVEAGAVIPAATHVVTEAGMGTFTEEVEGAAPVRAPLSATTAPAARNAAIKMTAAIDAARTTAAVVGLAGAARPAMPPLPS